ncbi:hypothetical protein N0B44_09930 [Roseibacterium beibuensis]|uniref:Uncharacterized protein n=1 Tax=[Roseibacterium] beibuensis TaxID=1193142 RepID=A0ABP9LF28_9RHOB|nr:hypothetical protein [Roseibacterium beibuensis]MCS6623230.1 hypothetical protein [Roseibacterium beibuensis]
MGRKISTLTALAVLGAAISSPIPGESQEVGSEFCEIYDRMDRAALQAELSVLLDEDPANVCVDYIVSILGEAPVAQVTPTDPY